MTPANVWCVGDEPLASCSAAAILSEAEHSARSRKAVIASTIGTTIAWYDFFPLRHRCRPFISKRRKPKDGERELMRALETLDQELKLVGQHAAFAAIKARIKQELRESTNINGCG